ncbi:MAG: ribosome biogenesis GTPase Der, partial [Myxococcota bacterium]
MTVRLPTVALVGRPNVGKSTLFNRMVGRKVALVHDQPGVTRDRMFGEMRFDHRVARVVDTGGMDLETADLVMSRVREQSQLAIDEADLILHVVDGQSGLVAADRDIAELLRRSGKPVAVIANKTDEIMHEERATEMYELGVEHVIPVSAEHGYRFGELAEWIMDAVSAPEAQSFDEASAPIPVSEEDLPEGGISRVEWPGGAIRVAVVGRPNAGKSSLINKLLGEERLVASEVAGTTMDSVDTEVEFDGQPFTLVDTAGIRRKRSVAQKLERFAVMAAVRGMDRADVVVLLLDGTERPSDQDSKIAALAHDRGKGLVIVASKWDLVENEEWRDNYEKAIRHDMPFLSYANVLRVSGKTGKNVHRIFKAVVDAQKERHRRVGTGELNRF